jgi:carboxyl-terminal processing protease
MTIRKMILGSVFILTLVSFVLISFAQSEPPEGGILEELKLFSKALGVIQYAYVKDVNVRDLFYEAMRGMVSSLKDPYSMFIDPKIFELLKISISGEYAGIGAKLDIRDDLPVIIGLMPNSVAEKGGLKIDDKILKIDGTSMLKKLIPDVAALLRGEAGKPVRLTIRREATRKTFDVTLIREKIEVESVKDVRIVGKAVGYMWIANFQENTMEQEDAALKILIDKGMKALIIDLRGNDGGILPSAVGLAERFLPKGDKIVSVESKVPEQQKEYFSSGEKTLPVKYPLVVLVNDKSASASEIFSAAMQDHKRGAIVGIKTFGKASVQSVIPLDDKTAMKLTTARYLSPNGRKIDGVGIMPDYVVQNGPQGSAGEEQQIRKALELLKEYL